MTSHSFLLLHGWQNRRPEGHWQRRLAGRLTGLGHRVAHPQLPDPDHPDLDRWLAELRRELTALRGTERVVICHSLACLLWLHALDRHPGEAAVDRVLLVAPPSASFVTQHPEIAAFAPPAITTHAAPTRIAATDNDPCCPEGAAALYGDGTDLDIIPGGGHLDLTAGYGDWPSLLDWCLDPATRITGRLGFDRVD